MGMKLFHCCLSPWWGLAASCPLDLLLSEPCLPSCSNPNIPNCPICIYTAGTQGQGSTMAAQARERREQGWAMKPPLPSPIAPISFFFFLVFLAESEITLR